MQQDRLGHRFKVASDQRSHQPCVRRNCRRRTLGKLAILRNKSFGTPNQAWPRVYRHVGTIIGLHALDLRGRSVHTRLSGSPVIITRRADILCAMQVRTHAGPPSGILSEHLSSNSALLWQKRPEMACADDAIQQIIYPSHRPEARWTGL